MLGMIEASDSSAHLGVLLVHEFRSPTLSNPKLMQNSMDWENFVHTFPELANSQCDRNQILGPVFAPGGGRVPSTIPLYLGKLITELNAAACGVDP